MSFLNKLKEAAGDVVEAGKKAADVAKEKVEDVQQRRKADDLAKQLGYLVARGSIATNEEGDRLAAQIREVEAELAAGDGSREQASEDSE